MSAGERYILANGRDKAFCNETIVVVLALSSSEAVNEAAGPENGAGVSASSSLSLLKLVFEV